MKLSKIIFYPALMVLMALSAAVNAQQPDAKSRGLHVTTDLYASHSNLMPYTGYQNDLLGTVHLGYSDFFIKPFLRLSYTNYVFGSGVAISDYNRTGVGVGVDAFVLPYLRLRLMTESVTNSPGGTYQQDYYGLIYNQYLVWDFIELNNYAESFYIPRVSSNSDKIDTFVRIQALKSFYLSSSAERSHALFPFVQYKAKFNDEANFGVSGHVISVGGGYKYFRQNGRHDTAFVLEGHSVVNQSSNFDGDWFQIFAALQYFYE